MTASPQPHGACRLAVVVPGAAVWANGQPSDTLRRRCQYGVRLFFDLGADYLVLTGGVGRHPPAEAELAAEMARQSGVPGAAILCEAASRNSFENLVLAADTVRAVASEPFTMAVVSDWYHGPRLRLTLWMIGQPGQVWAVPQAAYRSRLSWLQWRPSLMEAIKLPYYALTLRRRWHQWRRP